MKITTSHYLVKRILSLHSNTSERRDGSKTLLLILPLNGVNLIFKISGRFSLEDWNNHWYVSSQMLKA